MILSKLKVEPRQNPARHSEIKKILKSKTSLPDNFTGTQTIIDQIKLSQSHEIQTFNQNQFEFNIIPPKNGDNFGEKMTKKVLPPSWLVNSNPSSRLQSYSSTQPSQNPQCFNEKQITNPKSTNNYEESQKTQSQSGDNLLKINKSQIQRILEMTVSDDQERQFNETNFKSHMFGDDLQTKSAFINDCNSENSEKINKTSNDHQNVNKSDLTGKNKSTFLNSEKSLHDLDQFYKKQFEVFSEYGLKLCQEKRLRKIQQIQRIELLKNQAIQNQFEQDFNGTQYFDFLKPKKLGKEFQKPRKCSAALLSNEFDKNFDPLLKKSKSKPKQSLSKDKKFKKSQITCSSKISKIKKIGTNDGGK